MSGSSLWLVPPPLSPLKKILTKLITTDVPGLFPDAKFPVFPAHVTLTSEIDPSTYGDDPQKWLDDLPLPDAEAVRVRFDRVHTQDMYFRRCYLGVEYEGVAGIAALARGRGVYGEEVKKLLDKGEVEVGCRTQEWLVWWRGAYGPHVSLMYDDVKIFEDKLREVTRVVEHAGVQLAQSVRGISGKVLEGWKGGVVWLVQTDRPIDEWTPIATREL